MLQYFRNLSIFMLYRIGKWTTGVIRRTFDYCRDIANDYATVAIESAVAARRRKLRSTVIASSLITLIYANRTVPSEFDMHDSLTHYRQQLATISTSVRNREAVDELRRRTQIVNESRYRYRHCCVFAIVTVERATSKCDLYEMQCNALKPSIFTGWIHDGRILDVGAFGRWWMLDKTMRNADVNDDEWATAVNTA